MLARTLCRAQVGLEAPLVQIEVHLSAGLPAFTIVGLPAAAVRESKERVRAALDNCGFEFPAGRITVNLAPADLPKEGGRFDLPIAVGVLVASGQLVPAVPLDRTEFYGELGLAGELKPIRGALLVAAHAAQAAHQLIVPSANGSEVALVGAVRGWPLDHLRAVCEVVGGARPASEHECVAQFRVAPAARHTAPAADLADVRGQLQAKRALGVAAAGGHSVLFIGPPGCGKTLLAHRLPTLLPDLSAEQSLEVAALLSASGRPLDMAAWARPPFRTPHHTASAHAIVGGGARARPGEITLAHCGVLFLDELPEYDRRVLESLREPLESGVVSVTRASAEMRYPAGFQLIAAMNPCPCGYASDSSRRCVCRPADVARYRRRISGPLLDRIDLRVELTPVSQEEWVAPALQSARSAAVAARVATARQRQHARQGCLNSRLNVGDLHGACRVSDEAEQLLATVRRRLDLSARSAQRVVRVARTIADLEISEHVEAGHMAEAVQLRRALEAVPPERMSSESARGPTFGLSG